MMKNRRIGFLSMLFTVFVLVSCEKEEKEAQNPVSSGSIVFKFDHLNGGEALQFDTMMYTNQAGNSYLVNEIQYFVSDVTLYRNDGEAITIDEWKDYHYVDTDLPETQTWEVYDDIPAGEYDSIAFTFGFDEQKNQSFMFVNPPESYMFWPEFLGGGYHYMKLNGKWLPQGQNQNSPFDFHMGIGQIYYSYPDSITGFIHNHFRVGLPGTAFSLADGETKSIEVIMNVENWFEEPHDYDHDVYGGYIMQNQEAMEKAKENGHNVFTVRQIESDFLP